MGKTEGQELVFLPLRDMADRHTGLTKPIADGFLEATRVCMDRHHLPPQIFSIRNGSAEINVVAEWEPADTRMQSAWANEIETTEAGACAVAIAAVEISSSLYAIRRADTGTGADYYIAPQRGGTEDLENCFRLEVSGTNNGNESYLKRLLKEKIQQAARGNSNLPAIAAVVGFQVLLILTQNLEAE